MTVDRPKRRLLPSRVRRLIPHANRRSKKVPVCSSVTANDAAEPTPDLQQTNHHDVINSSLGKPPSQSINDQLLAFRFPAKQSIPPIHSLYPKLGFDRSGTNSGFKKLVKSTLRRCREERPADSNWLSKWVEHRPDLLGVATKFLADNGEGFWPANVRAGIKFSHENLILLLMQLFWRMSHNAGRGDKSANGSTSQIVSTFAVPGVIEWDATTTDIYAKLKYSDNRREKVFKGLIKSFRKSRPHEALTWTKWQESQCNLIGLAGTFLAQYGEKCWPAGDQSSSEFSRELLMTLLPRLFLKLNKEGRRGKKNRSKESRGETTHDMCQTATVPIPEVPSLVADDNHAGEGMPPHLMPGFAMEALPTGTEAQRGALSQAPAIEHKQDDSNSILAGSHREWQHFQFLAKDNHTLKATLEHYALHSTEAEDARQSGRWAHAFRRLTKTQDAVITASPFSVAFVALADDYIYCNGMLCYIHHADKNLHLLNLHQPVTEELVIDIHGLLNYDPNFSPSDTYDFCPIHYASNILCCMYTPPRIAGQSRLFVIDVDQRTCLTNHVLSSRNKIFVRNTSKYLFCGTQSEMGDDGFKRWRLEHFDMTNRKWAPGYISLSDVVGTDVGETVSFEIIDDHFYAVSSSTTADDYCATTSYYHGLRFPVSSPISQNIQMMSKKAMWRRDNRDGPVDDRWSILKLNKCHKTGKIVVMECLREFHTHQGRSLRSAYRTEVIFRSADDGSDSEDEEDGPWDSPEPVSAEEKPDAGRDPSAVHREDESTTDALHDYFVRSYNSRCDTFIDLMNSPHAVENSKTSPLVRFICRRRATDPETSDPHSTVRIAQRHNTVSYWPPQTEADENGQYLPVLNGIINPGGPNFRAEVSGVADERSIVYAVGDRGPRCLVSISFDPSARLPGLTRWVGRSTTPGEANIGQPVQATREHVGSRSIASPAGESTHQKPAQAVRPEAGLNVPQVPAWFRTVEAMSWRHSSETGAPIGFDMAY
ncbi:hypothetical protein CcaCcLH18_12842 [Colletotrichum camelliae]|nr:hypothetical protein CcaCcLH18_12842 [Colletotrichum camelliae]